MQIKLLLLFFLFCVADAVNAQQASDAPGKQRQPQSLEKGQSKKDAKPAEEVKQNRRRDQPFIPSEQVSPDVPVAFPADI